MYKIIIKSKKRVFKVKHIRSTVKIIAKNKRGLPGVGIPAGGTTGQHYAKKSNADYDGEWVNAGTGSVSLVNGQSGVVVLDPDDLDDTSTTNKFATASELADIASNTSARHTHSNKALLDTYTQTETDLADAVAKKHTAVDISGKQDVLVSGTNIKTINSTSLLGSGDIVVGGAVDSVNSQTGVVVLDQDDIGDGTTYKQYSSTEKTKLAGIETGADVTDATNVAAAGAFMKSVDDTDDITVGTTNKFTTSSDISKLAGIEALADVTDATNVAAAGAKMDSMATNKLLGRGTGGTGSIEEITLGTNLSLSGTTLNATGGGGASDWGDLGGTLSDQTDLQAALDDKFDTADVIDEDNMVSDSATKVPTQQSTKAYVDSGTVTMTNKTLTSPVLNTGVSGTAIVDEDDMASNSATKIPTQQSVKAYADTKAPITSPVFTTNITTPLVVGGSSTTSDLSFQTTSGAGTTGADMHFLVGNNGATEAMTVLNSGNIGVGVVAPLAKLSVQGTGTTTGKAFATYNSSAVEKFYITDAGDISAGPSLTLGGATGSAGILNFFNAAVKIARTGASGLEFSTGAGGGVKMTIDSSGNVGIGNTPAVKLDVTGEARVSTAGTDATSVVTVGGTQTMTSKTLTSPVLNTGVSGTAIDTDGTLTANSDTKLASQKAIKTYSGLYVNSKAGGLVTNGSGLYGDNTNFTGYTYLATDKPTGASGSFKTPNTSQNLGTTDELIAVDPFQRYRYSFSAKQISGSGNFYGSVVPYDIDKIQITPSTYMVQTGTLTTLAVELKAGDTTMTLTNATNWYNGGGGSYLRRAIFWNYTDSTGYTWPAETYSRNNTGYDFWNSGGISGNVVTLKTTYAGVTVPVGTAVSNGSDGGTYMYIGATNVAGPASWTSYSGDFGGAINPNTTAASVYLPISTAYIKAGLLYNMSGSSSYQAFANINLRVIEKLDTDGTLSANSDTKLASQKAVKTYVDTTAGTYVPLAGGTMTGTLTGRQVAPSADSTYTLGTSTNYYSNGYMDRLYLNSTAYLDGSTAGQINPTGSFGSTNLYNGASLTLYNTTDQTTNYERVRQYWSGNVFNITGEQGGTGTVRMLQLSVGNSFQLRLNSSATLGMVSITGTSGVASGIGFLVNPTLTATSTTQSAQQIAPTINQTSTAGYTALLINPTETSTGSGTKNLIDAQVGGTSKFKVANTGDAEITTSSAGVILKSPDGTRWRVKIDNTGTLTTTSI